MQVILVKLIMWCGLSDRWGLEEFAVALDARLDALVEHAAPPEFLAKQGVATQVASALLVTVADNPTRLHSEAGFAALSGHKPPPRPCSAGTAPPGTPDTHPAPPHRTARQDRQPRSGTDADANRPTTYRNLSARPTSVNTPKVNEDYLHIKHYRVLSVSLPRCVMSAGRR
jgi:hypothetical protein